jgi:hypothetical protein
MGVMITTATAEAVSLLASHHNGSSGVTPDLRSNNFAKKFHRQKVTRVTKFADRTTWDAPKRVTVTDVTGIFAIPRQSKNYGTLLNVERQHQEVVPWGPTSTLNPS